MDLDLVRRQAAAANHLAVVATSRANGSVHASLVSAGVLDDPITGAASIGMVVRGDARKLVYLRRSLQATTVFHSGPQWVGVEGPVRLAGPDDESGGIPTADVLPLLRAIFVAAGGTHDDWAEYDRVMAAEGRVAVLVETARITTNR
jgi:Pyridoxamine 5'-phosphate oxidase